MKSKVAFLSLLIIGLLGTAMAQSRGRIPHRQAPDPGMRQEMRAYAEKHIHPIMAAQRQKLDASLSLSEKQEIAEIRTALQALRQSEQKLWQQQRQNQNPPGEAPQGARYEQQKARRLLMTRAWAIADAHEADILALLAEVKPQAEIWQEERQKIAEKYRPEDRPARPQKLQDQPRYDRPRGPGANMSHPGRGQGKGHEMGMRGPALHNPVQFLLWDPTASPERTGEAIRVFPNPSRRSNEIHFRLTESGKVSIRLLDKDGQFIRSVLDESFDAGRHIQSVDLGDLESGLYFYQIETPGGSTTRKIIIE